MKMKKYKINTKPFNALITGISSKNYAFIELTTAIKGSQELYPEISLVDWKPIKV